MVYPVKEAFLKCDLAMKALILQLVLLSLSALAQKPTKLATDYKATRDVINASSEAYIAVFTSLGPADAGSPGESVYAEAQLSLIRPIKGSDEAKVVSCTLNVTTFPPELKEELPKLGVEYIAVGEPGKSRFVIAKLLEASEENVKLVSDLFSKAMHEDKSHLQSATQSAINQSPAKTFTPSVIQGQHRTRFELIPGNQINGFSGRGGKANVTVQ
jgi:hypothetical protein